MAEGVPGEGLPTRENLVREIRESLKAQGLKKGEDYETGQYPLSALGKAIAAAHTDGFVKIIRGLPRGEILGAHIMGDQATELIADSDLFFSVVDGRVRASGPPRTRRARRAGSR